MVKCVQLCYNVTLHSHAAEKYIGDQTNIYGKTFKGENFRAFCGFSADHERFPLESLAVYSTQWPRPDAPQKFSSEWCILRTTVKVFPSKVLPYMIHAY